MASTIGWLQDLLSILEIPHYIVIGIIIVALFTRHSKLFDWLPVLILWLIYDLMENVASEQDHINVRPVYDLELKLFGWLFGGTIPAFWAQERHNVVLDITFTVLYSLHVVAPIVVATAIYYKSKDKDLFKEYMYVFILTVTLSLITYAFYPVAPPWYIWNDGNVLKFDQPEIMTGIPGSAAGLIEIDRLLGMDIFSSIYGRFNTNPYAALPSMHAALSFMAAYYAIKKYGRERVGWMVFYPLGVCVGAVYLNHHYIVDLLLGIVYVLGSIIIVTRIRHILLNRSVNKVDKKIDGEATRNY